MRKLDRDRQRQRKGGRGKDREKRESFIQIERVQKRRDEATSGE